MIDLHHAPTPNGWKISIMLEELGLPYTVVPVNIRAGELFKSEFLAISPNNRIPAIVDHAPADGGGPFSVFETGAILIFRGVPTGPREARPDDRLRREPGIDTPRRGYGFRACAIQVGCCRLGHYFCQTQVNPSSGGASTMCTCTSGNDEDVLG
jgi:Glutathione S-transferase, N-terminal domain